MDLSAMPMEAHGAEAGIQTELPKKIGFFLVPSFSMMALSAATEPLRAANRITGRPLYSWHLLSADGEAVASSSGFTLLPDLAITSTEELDQLFVVASLGVSDYRNAHVFEWLRRFAAKGKPLGAISLGAMLLARAGLLNGYKCTIHWESQRDFAEEFPSLEVSPDIYCIDRNRSTCGGGTAAMDLMLDLIVREHGQRLATEVADQFLHTRIRTSQESQKTAIQWRYGVEDRRIVKAIALMEQNIENPISMRAIASLVGISHRQFERLWLKHFEESPARFYQELRVKAAQKLVRESTYSLFDIAVRCGFSSASHFGRCYRQFFNCTPGEERSRKRP
jgi:AraC family transcriptional regulator, glycine betaine-responsive activator